MRRNLFWYGFKKLQPNVCGVNVKALRFALAMGAVMSLAMAPAVAQSPLDALIGQRGEAVRADDIPAGDAGWAFRLGAGAGRDLTPPSFSRSVRIDANFRAGFGYRCGAFNPYHNVEAILNQAKAKFKRLPQAFVMAAQSAVAALPAYLLNKINPSLYNVITKHLDEAFRLFEISFKDCQQMEREIGLGQNPYHNLVRAAIGDRLRVTLGAGGVNLLPDALDEVYLAGPSNGVVMSAGRRFGGENQPPIESLKDIATAGINLLTDRPADRTDPFDPALAVEHPITEVFPQPSALVEFLTEIYGRRAYSLAQQGVAQATPGKGYQPQYIALRDQNIQHLTDYVWRRVDRQAFETQSGLLIPPVVIDDLRRLPRYEQAVMIDDHARREAIEQLHQQLQFALQALKSGLKEANIAQSEAYEIIEREVMQVIAEIREDLAQLQSARLGGF